MYPVSDILLGPMGMGQCECEIGGGRFSGKVQHYPEVLKLFQALPTFAHPDDQFLLPATVVFFWYCIYVVIPMLCPYMYLPCTWLNAGIYL